MTVGMNMTEEERRTRSIYAEVFNGDLGSPHPPQFRASVGVSETQRQFRDVHFLFRESSWLLDLPYCMFGINVVCGHF